MTLSVADIDREVRLAVFDFLSRCLLRWGEVVPFRPLFEEFVFHGVRVPLLGPTGIFKPRILPEMPISIATAPEVPGKQRPYDDRPAHEGLLIYRYRGTDPLHRDNVGLRLAMTRGVPLVYFYGVEKGMYRPTWPVFIVGEEPTELAFHVAMDDQSQILGPGEWQPQPAANPRRRYITSQVQRRLHQTAFRAHVIRAYQKSCAICRLRHPELLDAAHIIGDKEERGLPSVRNGLSLCAIHHKAFDRNILAVRPDYAVEVRGDILREIDGPMLRHGLQGFQGKRILLPRRLDERPDPVALEERYETFRAAG